MQSVVLIDYGSGNLRSAEKALIAAAGDGARVVATDDPDIIRRADRVVLPGVGAFAVPRDHPAKMHRHGVQRLHEHIEVLALAVDHGISRHAVGQDRHHVVGGGVPVDAQHVERVLDVSRKRLLKHRGRDGRVRRQKDQHGRHIGVDHAAALRDAAQAAGHAADLE